MTVPSPSSHPHTDLLAMLDDAASRYRGHGIPERATAAAAAIRELTADRDRLAARVETLEAFVAKVRQLDWEAQTHGDFGAAVANALAAIPPSALRALVAPDTPTSPTEPVTHRHGYVHDQMAYECGEDVGPWVEHTHPAPMVSPTDTGDPT